MATIARRHPRNVDCYLKRTSHGSNLPGGGQRPGAGPLRPGPVVAPLHRGAGLRRPRRPGRHHRRGHPPGAMAGTVDLVQLCYTGLETREDVLWLNPSLPGELDGLDFDVRYRGHRASACTSTGPGSGSGCRPRAPPRSGWPSTASWPSWTWATPASSHWRTRKMGPEV